jgi:hypothetical protein
MAERPVFLPGKLTGPLVTEVTVRFKWVPGLSFSQKQKRVRELHDVVMERGLGPVLEVSTKSYCDLGRELSAFNLLITLKSGGRVPVEVAYQSSKAYTDEAEATTAGMTPRRARERSAGRAQGPLRGFVFEGEKWEPQPPTAFYDWLYVSALVENPRLATELLEYSSFTDIEFNPRRQVSCQARSAALFVCLSRRGWLGDSRLERSIFIEMVHQRKDVPPKQEFLW